MKSNEKETYDQWDMNIINGQILVEHETDSQIHNTTFDLDEVYDLLHKHKMEQSTNDKVMLHMEFENQNSYTYYSLLSKEECIERLKLIYYAFNTDGAVYFGE